LLVTLCLLSAGDGGTWRCDAAGGVARALSRGPGSVLWPFLL